MSCVASPVYSRTNLNKADKLFIASLSMWRGVGVRKIPAVSPLYEVVDLRGSEFGVASYLKQYHPFGVRYSNLFRNSIFEFLI